MKYARRERYSNIDRYSRQFAGNPAPHPFLLPFSPKRARARILIIIPAIMVMLMIGDRAMKRFSSDMIHGEGIVVSKTREHSPGGKTKYILELEITMKDGTRQHALAAVSPMLWHTVSVHSPIHAGYKLDTKGHPQVYTILPVKSPEDTGSRRSDRTK